MSQNSVMFEHVILRRAKDGDPISIGEVLEALLYYQRVHVVIDRSTLFDWLKSIGPDEVLSLLRRSDFSAVYCEEILATHTEKVGTLEVHQLVTFKLAGHEGVGRLKESDERLIFELERSGVENGAAKRFANQFLRRVPVRKLSGSHYVQGGVSAASRRDLSDQAFIKSAFQKMISQGPGAFELGETFRLDMVDSDIGLHVFHNIDFERINARRAAVSPTVQSLTIAYLLSQIQEARADLALASFYGGDFITSHVVSSVITTRHEALTRRTQLNTAERVQFAEIVLPDSPTFAEVVNAGERTFREALMLIDQASRFKHWLKTVNPDEGVVRTYMRDVSSEGWIQKLPAKSLRYMLTLALDATNPIAGVVAGFADNFLVEKLLGGWRPNHFISSRLSPFVGGT